MTEQEQMNDLIDKVYQWGVDRKIIGNGKLETQWLKLLSEFGEMCDTLAKGGDPIDDIGDQLVVLIMLTGIRGGDRGFKDCIAIKLAESTWRPRDSAVQLCKIYSSLFRGVYLATVADAAMELRNIAKNHNHTLYQCLEHAYNQIKDRKGYLNEQGVFIKE